MDGGDCSSCCSGGGGGGGSHGSSDTGSCLYWGYGHDPLGNGTGSPSERVRDIYVSIFLLLSFVPALGLLIGPAILREGRKSEGADPDSGGTANGGHGGMAARIPFLVKAEVASKGIKAVYGTLGGCLLQDTQDDVGSPGSIAAYSYGAARLDNSTGLEGVGCKTWTSYYTGGFGTGALDDWAAKLAPIASGLLILACTLIIIHLVLLIRKLIASYSLASIEEDLLNSSATNHQTRGRNSPNLTVSQRINLTIALDKTTTTVVRRRERLKSAWFLWARAGVLGVILAVWAIGIIGAGNGEGNGGNDERVGPRTELTAGGDWDSGLHWGIFLLLPATIVYAVFLIGHFIAKWLCVADINSSRQSPQSDPHQIVNGQKDHQAAYTRRDRMRV